MELKKLPLSDESFREIIEGNYLYADKTKYIHTMINKFKCCFLARPRRFGKTLLVDTIEEVFLGNRELFDGLWISTDSDYAFDRFPVLRLNMAYTKLSIRADLEARIESDLREAAETEELSISDDSYGEMLGQFLRGVKRKYGVGTVVLIDEYDAPVTRHMSNRKLASDNRDVLHDFYTSIKKNLKYIRFALVTGITRFTMTALDSGQNNIKDISLMSDYSEICGFTLSELDMLFSDRFENTLKSLKKRKIIAWNAKSKELIAEMKRWYGGYSWLGSNRVFNPYSILNFFDQNNFDDYWTELGVPSHLACLVRENPLEFIQPSLGSYTSIKLLKIELSELDVVPVMFHSGYLTLDAQVLKDVEVDDKIEKVDAFTFRIPNLEIRLNYRAAIFKEAFDPEKRYFSLFSRNIPKALLESDSAEVARLVGYILASINFFQHQESEGYYHSIICTAFIAAGIDVMSETSGSHGRPDMAVSLKGRVRVVIELKYRHAGKTDDDEDPAVKVIATKDLDSALDDAESQIRSGKYGESLMAISDRVICLALAIRGRTQVAARFVTPLE
ncbi:MAG: ATP-binding protein [Deltaproteobacteria bacterium]|jgi:hypothetical protein|nr:ATP-binding protein [Deltaproteobacteria bacterium]